MEKWEATECSRLHPESGLHYIHSDSSLHSKDTLLIMVKQTCPHSFVNHKAFAFHIVEQAM